MGTYSGEQGAESRLRHCTVGDHDFSVAHGVVWTETITWRGDPTSPTAAHRRLQTVVCCAECAHGRMMTAEPGDWIISGSQGERYPWTDSIFRATYEPVDE